MTSNPGGPPVSREERAIARHHDQLESLRSRRVDAILAEVRDRELDDFESLNNRLLLRRPGC